MPTRSRNDAMKPWQLTALHHPCVEGEQTAHPRFYRTIGDWHVCLTMNVGFE